MKICSKACKWAREAVKAKEVFSFRTSLNNNSPLGKKWGSLVARGNQDSKGINRVIKVRKETKEENRAIRDKMESNENKGITETKEVGKTKVVSPGRVKTVPMGKTKGPEILKATVV